jgi:hypothetical protein
MNYIDRISRAVFGCIPLGDCCGQPQAVDFEGLPNMEDLVRHLT